MTNMSDNPEDEKGDKNKVNYSAYELIHERIPCRY